MKNLAVLNETQIEKASTDVLKEKLAESLEFTAKHLTYMGMLWRELESRGEDLSHLKKGMSIYIPMIAYGKLDARIVINYAGQQTLLTALSDLDKESQLKLIENPVVEVFDSASEKVEEKELIDLKVSEIQQIFSPKGLRSTVDQVKFATKTKAKTRKKRKPRKLTKVEIKDEMLLAGGREIDIVSVIYALEAHYSVDLKELLEEVNGY